MPPSPHWGLEAEAGGSSGSSNKVTGGETDVGGVKSPGNGQTAPAQDGEGRGETDPMEEDSGGGMDGTHRNGSYKQVPTMQQSGG